MKLIMENWRKYSTINENKVNEQEISEGVGVMALAAALGTGEIKIDGNGSGTSYLGAQGLQKIQQQIDELPEGGKKLGSYEDGGETVNIVVTKAELQTAFDNFTKEASNNLKHSMGTSNFDWDKDGEVDLIVAPLTNAAGFEFPTSANIQTKGQVPDYALGMLVDMYAQPEVQDAPSVDTDLEPGSVEYKMSTMDPEKKAELEKAMKDPRYQQWKANQRK